MSASPQETHLKSRELVKESRTRHPLIEFQANLFHRRTALIGTVILAVVVFAAIFANFIAPHDPNRIQMGDALQGPSVTHWLGTDELGRDILSRVIYGSRVSLFVGVMAISIATVIGLPLGLAAGFYGRWIDIVLSRLMDALLAFPSIILALAVISVLGPSLRNTMIAIGIVFVPAFMRLTRSGVLAVQANDYVTAAVVSGATNTYVMRRTILPNIVAPLLVHVTLMFASAIIVEAALSFLGLGVQPPTASWGQMLNTGRRFMQQTLWFSSSAGVAIFLTILSLNLLGDGLRDVLDPRLRNR